MSQQFGCMCSDPLLKSATCRNFTNLYNNTDLLFYHSHPPLLLTFCPMSCQSHVMDSEMDFHPAGMSASVTDKK